MNDVTQAILGVLSAEGEPLHWTVIQDRALKSGAIDPFAVGDVRGAVLRALAELSKRGLIERTGKGTYRFVSKDA